MLGFKVLLIDCDRQRNTSKLLPLDKREPPTLTQVLKNEATFSDAIRSARKGLDILPSDKNLHTAANYILIEGMSAYTTISQGIADISGYDFVFFDLPSNYSPITEAVILASEEMIIPCELEPFSVEGLIDMIDTLNETLTKLRHQVVITGIVPFNKDDRYAMSDMYLDSLIENFKERVLPSIRTDADIRKAQSRGETVFEYNPDSKGAQDFKTLADFLIQKEV